MPVSWVNYFFSIFGRPYFFFSYCLAAFWAFLLNLFGVTSTFFSLLDIIFTIIMQQIDTFEARLKQSAQFMAKGSTKMAEVLLKQLQMQVRSLFDQKKIQQNDRLSQIQIAIYNNLACIYQKKGKYKSSLYHLQLAQKLENSYFNHKYNDSVIPVPALQKLATTYSNLSAIQSKLGNVKEALQNIEFAIQIMKRSETLNNHDSFIFLYYNYSVLLEGASRHLEASKCALEGMRIAQNKKQHIMIAKYQELLERLKNLLAKQQYRKQRQIRKYLKGEIGVVRKIEDFNQVEFNNDNTSKQGSKNSLLQTIQKHRGDSFTQKPTFACYTRQKFTNFRPRIQTQISNRQYKQNASLGILQHQAFGKIKRNFLTSNFTSSNPTLSQQMNKTTIGIVEAYGLNQKRKRQFSSLNKEMIIDNRIKDKKKKLQQEIGQLGQKNEVLQKIIQKLYLSQKKAKS